MKRSLKIVLWIIALVLVSVVIFWFSVRVPNKDEPDRLSTIPKTAVWKGGVDEGFWFDVVNVDTVKKAYRIKVYNDYKGELVMDADFVKQDSCNAEYPLNKSVLEYVSYFEFDKIVMTKDCNLKMIKPAYGGSFWELDKEQTK